MGGLGDNLRKFREAGPLRGTAKAARLAGRRAGAELRARRLERRPLTASPAEMREALGGEDPVSVLRGRVLEALPDVVTFEARIDAMDEAEAVLLLERAERLMRHEFDLLGSGPVSLGTEIDWSRDFKSGRAWPPVHISRFEVVFPGDSDVKVPWELSRSQHLPTLAAAHRLTGDERYLAEIGAQLDSWIAANPVEFGPNWACTMDVAIRGANWVATLAMCAEGAVGEPWLERAIASLLLHARFARTHLEVGEVRGNHYLSDVGGLLVIAALFSRSPEGRGWLEWGAGELETEMRHQVHPDGVDHEASIPYHRLVAELFAVGGDVVRALVPGAPSADFDKRLGAMLGFTRDYTRADGLAPQIGDADDGRFLPLGDYGAVDHRDHSHLLRRGSGSGGSAVSRPAGGFHVLRAEDLHVVFRAGDTGMRGLGGHSHNDQLSFELSARGQAVVADPGAYIYTADPEARNQFRSTAFHSTLQIDGAEQNEIDPARLFALPDRTRTELLAFDEGSVRALHHGFEALTVPAVHERKVRLDGRSLTVIDTVRSDGGHDLMWTFTLAGGEPALEADRCRVTIGGVGVEVVAPPGVELAIEEGWSSPSYGVREPAPFLRGRVRSEPGESTWTWELRVE